MAALEAPNERQLVVEVAWEVCWQLGGIYTVLRSKAPVTAARYGDRYCLVGPYNHATAEAEFEALPLDGPFARAVELMRERGFEAHYGRWLITGRPRVVLLDFQRHAGRIAEWKYFLWKDHFIETGHDAEVDQVVLFGYLVAEFFKALVDAVKESVVVADEEGTVPWALPILAQFHEWMAGVALPEIRRLALPVATVFTTHATLLGRYLAGDNPAFYHELPHIDPVAAAHSRGIYQRHAIERSAAWSATVFTTVSDITGYEAQHFLGRKPDVLLPNGLNVQRFAALHEFQNLHARYKRQIHEFVMGHFFPSYAFDLDRTLYIVCSGRYEYRNKGLDLFVEALARLNWRLKRDRRNINIVAFIVTRAPNKGVSVGALQSQMLLRELKNSVGDACDELRDKLLGSLVRGGNLGLAEMIDETTQMRLRRMTLAWKRKGWPAIVTHDMLHDADDALLSQLRNCMLFNAPQDPVKVIFHPEFLSKTSPLMPLDYEEFVRGCHLGVFPSYYEPWGYTPMECAALGVPAITSDLAGFGTWVQTHISDHAARGLAIVQRRYLGFEESANQLADLMERMLILERRERIDLRNKVEALSVQFDWKRLAQYYWQAHALALERFAENG